MKKSLLIPLILVLAGALIFSGCAARTNEVLSLSQQTDTGAFNEPVPTIASRTFEPEVSYEDGVPLAANIAPVIILSGSDYDMGYQYAQQLNHIYGSWALKMKQRNFTKEEIAALKAYQGYIEEYTPEFIDMFRGMAAGATDASVELSYEEVLASYCIDPFTAVLPTYPGTEPSESQRENPPTKSCSGFAVWGSATKDGKLIAAGSDDHGIMPEFVVIVLPETGNNYIYIMGLPSAPCIHPAMNNKGLAHAHHGAGTPGNEQPGYGVTEPLMIQHTLRFANNAAEALTIQLAYPTRADGLWADVSGDAFDLECRDPLIVRRAGDHGEEDFLYATNNIIDKSMSVRPFLEAGSVEYFGWPFHYFEHGGWNVDDMDSVRRNLHMWNALHNYHGQIDLDFAKMMWRMPGPAPDYPTLEEAEIQLFETYGIGWDTYIGSLDNGMVGIMQPDNGDGGLYFAACGGIARQGEPLTAEAFHFRIANTFTLFELQLASDPAAVVGAAQKRSKYDLYYANKELRKLTYADVAYAPLDKIFNRAATESQKGEYFLALARRTQGNESMSYYGKAIRAFAKCQAYAKQVYEALVPSADDPTDLGLREWFGSWGQWENAPVGTGGNPDP